MFTAIVRRKWCRRFCSFWIAIALISFVVFGWIAFLRKSSTENSEQNQNFQKSMYESRTAELESRVVHEIVGHYMGDGSFNEHSSNLTDEVINVNLFDPKPNEGKDGKPVIIPSFLSNRMHQLFHINRFNLMASDRIPLNRTLPDVRRKKCMEIPYRINGNHSVSVIIVFHNEAWSTLLRTVTSVINRSPKYLLKEIILVDDASTRKFLRNPLEVYVSQLSVFTYVIRSDERKGLIRSRLIGARKAVGSILVFLDAHCECTTGWLESLIQHVSTNKTKVACPVIDIINDETFAYVRSFERHLGGFNWDLHFRWYTVDMVKQKRSIRQKPSNVEPFSTPVMAGGLFAINREYFFEIGAYDDGMEIWGGENLELSFRIWQCGGSIDIVPCSHVGHIFRKSSPYMFPGGVSNILYSNLIRVALVWMDDWSKFYFKFHPEANETLRNKQDVTDRIKLREKLQCRPFVWYLKNIWKQRFMPMDDRFFGKIRHKLENLCLEKPASKTFHNQPTGLASALKCSMDNDLSQMFVTTSYSNETETGVVSIATDESICLHADTKSNDEFKSKVQFIACTGSDYQKWIYEPASDRIKHWLSNLCIEISSKQSNLVLNTCTTNISQRWIFESKAWK